MIVFYLLCAIGVNSRISGVFGAVTALLYAAFVGFTPGAARAALMMAFLMGTRTFLRRSDSFTSLSLALLIILFINPYSLFSTGFQFTFICTAGLITVGPLVERLKLFVLKQSVGAGFFKRALLKAPCFFAVPLLLSFVAALFSFPVAFAHTDAFSVITPLTNLIAVPAFTLALQLLAVGVMLGYMIPGSGAVITVPAGWLIGRINGMAEYFYDSDVGFVTLHDALMLVPLFIVIAGTVCIIISRRNRLKAAAAVLVCFCVSFGACALAINARVSGETVIEYGKSKSEYIYVSDCGTNAYIDFGGRSANRTAVYENGSAHLDAFIIAKFDGYSAARFESLSGSMKVHKVYIPSDVNGNIYASEAIKRLANKRNCDIIIFNDKLLVENDGSEIYCDENGGYVAVTVDGRTVQFFNGVSDGYYNTGVSVICYKNALAPERVTGKDVYAISDSQDLFKDALIFDKYIRFVIKTGEGGYKVYEPRYS